MQLPIDKIDLPERDLRASVDQDSLDELANSMQSEGQIQPCAVFLKPDGRYEVIAGARRWRAARILNWIELRCEISDAPNEASRDAIKLIENVQREDLTPIEEAYGLLQLVGDDELDIRKLQRQTGKNRAWVKDRLELLDLPDDCQQAIQAGLVSKGVGKALGRIENADVRRQYLKHAAENGLTTEGALAWANQAEFAEAGVLAMQDHERRQADRSEQPDVMGQLYNCYSCREAKPTNQVNFFTLCRLCMEMISELRDQNAMRPPPPGVDSDVKLAPSSSNGRS